MLRKFSFWIRTTIVCQLLTTAMHSASFFIQPIATNETEQQLIYLISTYKMDMGNGFFRTYSEIVVSLSINLTLLCLFAGVLNIILIRTNAPANIFKSILLLQAIVFGILFLVFIRYAFLPPIVCVGLILVACIGSYWSIRPLFIKKNSDS